MVQLLCGSVIVMVSFFISVEDLQFDTLSLIGHIRGRSVNKQCDAVCSIDAKVPPQKRQSLGYLSALAQGLAMVPP